jgi:hypothetical protein
MKIGIMDASNYFKGLLLLIRKDREITQPEIDQMKSIGKSLGFEERFCDNAIGDILDNTYIEDVPPVFSTKELAIKFIKDGLSLAFVDHAEIHPDEKQWLESITEKNGLGFEFFSQELKNAQNKRGYLSHLEVFDLTVESF